MLELMSVMEIREFECVEVMKKVEGLDKECMDGKVVIIQLKVDLKNSEEQKCFATNKVLILLI